MIDPRQIVFIVSGDADVRSDLRDLLAAQGVRTAEFETAASYMASTEPEAPACLIVDVTRSDGAEALVQAVCAALDIDNNTRALRARYARLTPREREVLSLVVSGLLNKQVASELGISEVTVEIHRGRVMQKMGASSFAELVRMSETLRNPLEGSSRLKQIRTIQLY
jgi:FixJ family two-component response regulator